MYRTMEAERIDDTMMRNDRNSTNTDVQIRVHNFYTKQQH